MPEDKILIKLTELEKKFDKKFEQHDKKFEEADVKFDRIVAKLLEHDKKFEEVDFKLDKIYEEFLSGQDAVMTILKRLDDDRFFTNKNVRQIEDKVEDHDKDIKKMKLQLKIA